MGRPKTTAGLPTQQAIRKAEGILTSLESDGADFVGVDDSHSYIWHREQLVNLWDHQGLLDFLEARGYIGKRTDNRMIIAAWIIFEGLKRCA
jgi:hypothetical protein